MATDETSILLIVLIAVVALVGVGLAASSFVTQRDFQRMMGGGMMDQDNTAAGPGGLEWGVLFLSVVVFVVAAALLLRARTGRKVESAAMPAMAPMISTEIPSSVPPPASRELPAAEPVPELTLMKLLDEDEKRMYLEVRDHGGQMYQRDLVALGTFSKAKVTRVLDRLETKGIVVRERHGMTNRVRIVGNVAK